MSVELQLSPADVRSAVTDFFADDAARGELRDIAEGRAAGYDPTRWRQLSVDVGVGGLLVPPHADGLGLDISHACAATEVAAAAVSPAPVRSTSAAAAALAATGTECVAWLREIATGGACATLTKVPPIATPDTFRVAGDRADGVLDVVTDGATARYLVIVGADDVAYGVDLADPTVRRKALSGMDFAHSNATLHLARTPVVPLLLDPSQVQRLHDQCELLLAAECLGVGRAGLRLAAEYARIRTQFGRIIGTNQAVSHRLAQTLIDVEGAAALLDTAIGALIDSAGGTPLAPLAAGHAAQVCTAATATAIQTLGGIGFTWEHDVQFMFRRSRALAAEGESPRRRLARAVERGAHRVVTR